MTDACIAAEGVRKRVALIYAFFPHYRAPVMRALATSNRYDFEFWGSTTEVEGIKPCPSDDVVHIRPLSFRNNKRGGRISGYWKPVFDRNVGALIVLGNPNLIDTWFIAIVGRIVGKKVLFWTHGWLRPEPYFKAWLRNLYFGLGQRILTYGERAKLLAMKSGFAGEKISPIYNSLDWDKARSIFEKLERQDLSTLRTELVGRSDLPLLICTARLTSLCRFDLLLEALAKLAASGKETRLLLVGDGPERSPLEAQAKRLNLSVVFTGALYDEDRLGAMIYAADLTISPGKVGLTAVHSLMYGTPVITHDNPDAQMPEVEAIVPGESGSFFKEGDVEDLVRTISHWLNRDIDRKSVRTKCHHVIRTKYNPVTQRQLIENALDVVFQVGSARAVGARAGSAT
ncbi:MULTISPECIES: glycosyltransferase [unclassified Bradyrhizobium]|uniref:glycosyltransferase n=1 Tax=unclassified Bradyrhizobium TaxID=2631580 RepID=UPI00211EF564|nr:MULTISPECIES: glycosyltransferase [unclassified Bradyrhizobium]MDD1532486.1 hypothetical protein [Bradyrhizobium sp. WBOS8]MDD1582490.1 hypothetical protein [Bradyrhizobium sp. WBOS4]UUO50867.1 hypothetical protein DCM78_30570 [Bradyrhizobium sp. WBOS04]UUO58246.1 hypothetical protein DCM80_03070 [Bradyrhizobium sp. WBOS08]